MAFINDQYYIDQTIKGNTNAFSVLVDQYKSLVFTLAYKMLKNREDAEEASQDIFIKIFNSLHKFKGESKFSTWIYRITYNNCLDKLKKGKKEVAVVYVDEFNEQQINIIENILLSIDEKERNNKIRECILLLHSEEAFLLTLYYFDDQSIEEIAKIINCTANNVKIKLFRSRNKLASILRKNLESEIFEYYER